MATKKLFSPAKLGKMTLQNRIVMAPMTRSRCVENNAPGPLVAEYYGQRASSLGLVVTEGTSPSPNGLGYARIPGVYSPEQIKGWKAVTDAVHAKGAKTFLQIMHCGRISHQANLPKGGVVMAPSAIKAGGKVSSRSLSLFSSASNADALHSPCIFSALVVSLCFCCCRCGRTTLLACRTTPCPRR